MHCILAFSSQKGQLQTLSMPFPGVKNYGFRQYLYSLYRIKLWIGPPPNPKTHNCMEETREISALLHLIDDPDEEVFSTISERIVSFGKGIIPNLEHLWENSPLEVIQERIELLIHRLHYRDLTDEFHHWKNQPEQDLLNGALLISKYQYPDLQNTSIYAEIEKMRRNIWLELNSYLTPLEQINVMTTILYNYYNLKGTEINYGEYNEFLLSKVLDTKKGNAIANGILYLVMAELLDVPIRAVNIPRQFILAYFDVDYNWQAPSIPAHKIQFYIDPMTGHVFTHKDVETYFKRISVPMTASYFKPMSKKRIIQFLLEEFAKCFKEDKTQYKQQELLILADLLSE
jgi:regulator of sirC expression with transglutaminase-like and TPR domain